MTEFTLDTSGEVLLPERPRHMTAGDRDSGLSFPVRWPDLSPFAQGFGRAMAASICAGHIAAGWPADKAAHAVAFRNWAPETLALILRDCEARRTELQQLYSPLRYGRTPTDGANFWKRRQSGLEPEYAARFPPLTHAPADDGKMHLREAP